MQYCTNGGTECGDHKTINRHLIINLSIKWTLYSVSLSNI